MANHAFKNSTYGNFIILDRCTFFILEKKLSNENYSCTVYNDL